MGPRSMFAEMSSRRRGWDSSSCGPHQQARRSSASFFVPTPRLRGGFKKLDPSRMLRDKMMPRRSASAHSGRCGESGLTLMAVALPPRLDVKESYGRLTIAMAQQSMAIVVSPPWEGRSDLPERSSGLGGRPL